jgi:CBS domain-containing protein
MPGSTSKWASGPLDFDVATIMPRLEAAMQVRLIWASPFIDCSSQDSIQAIIDDRKLLDFDHIPVRHEGQVVGVFNRSEDHAGKTFIREAMAPLNERFLLSADAPLMSFLERADDRPFCLVLDGENLSGIVTISDLQKLPVRPALFLLVTHLEILLAEWIRRESPDEERWLALLKKGQRAKIKNSWEDLRDKNLVIDMVSATSFTHKMDAASALGAFADKNSAPADLLEIRELRDSMAHAWDYGTFPEQAQKVPKRIRLAKEYIQLMNDALKGAK